MPTRIISSPISVSTAGLDAITAFGQDMIIIEPGVLVSATGPGSLNSLTYGIYGSTGTENVDIQVFGGVIGTHGGIHLFGTTAQFSLFVGAAGRVLSDGIGALLAGDASYFVNHGLIRGQSRGVDLSGATYLMNSGTIQSTFGSGVLISSGTSNVTVINTGTISGNPIFGTASLIAVGTGDAFLWNSGMMVGNVILGDGSDLYQGGGQILQGHIDGRNGDDTIIGGAGDDDIRDFSGANWLAGGDGADRIMLLVDSDPMAVSHAFGGVMGGADTSARDTIQLESSGPGANIFLSTGAAVGVVTRIDNNAVVGYITGFENATGTYLADAIFGTSAANVIDGEDGGDWMVGNGGADRFVFTFASHADAGDQIRDFRRSEGDRIDLSAIDANTTIADNEAFVFRTTRTNNLAGEVVVTNFGNSARVDLYTNADNIVDGTFVVVYGEAGVTNLQVADFIL